MPEGSAGQSPLVVFVVEDEVLIQPLLIEPLEEAGYKVLVAFCGGEAIKLLDGEDAGSIRAVSQLINQATSAPPTAT